MELLVKWPCAFLYFYIFLTNYAPYKLYQLIFPLAGRLSPHTLPTCSNIKCFILLMWPESSFNAYLFSYVIKCSQEFFHPCESHLYSFLVNYLCSLPFILLNLLAFFVIYCKSLHNIKIGSLWYEFLRKDSTTKKKTFTFLPKTVNVEIFNISIIQKLIKRPNILTICKWNFYKECKHNLILGNVLM